VASHALGAPPPATNCHTFSDPLSSSVTYFMDDPLRGSDRQWEDYRRDRRVAMKVAVRRRWSDSSQWMSVCGEHLFVSLRNCNLNFVKVLEETILFLLVSLILVSGSFANWSKKRKPLGVKSRASGEAATCNNRTIYDFKLC